MIRIEPALLSPRFVDDGWNAVPVGRRAQRMLHQLARDLRGDNGALMGEHALCPCCGGTDAWLIAEKDRHGIPAPMLLCKACALVFAQRWMRPETADRYYSSVAQVMKTQIASPDELFRRRTAPGSYCWRRHAWIAAAMGEPISVIGRVIEIGCSDGANLVPFARQGATVAGFDLDYIRVQAGRRMGLDLHVGAFPEKGLPPADLVILSHVVEHVVDVPALLARAASLLAPAGRLYVEVPGIGLVGPRGRRSGYPGYPPTNDYLGLRQFEHNYDFDLASLTRLAARAGLQVLCGDEAVRCLMVSGSPIVQSARPAEYLATMRAAEADWQGAQFRGKKLARMLITIARSWLRP